MRLFNKVAKTKNYNMFNEIKLPQDCLPHDENIEWWYFNGHLKAKNGDKFAFMDCLFKANPSKLNIPYLRKLLRHKHTVYFAHSVLSDIKSEKSYKEIQNISIMSVDSFKRPLFFANYCDFMALAKGYVMENGLKLRVVLGLIINGLMALTIKINGLGFVFSSITAQILCALNMIMDRVRII